MSRAFPSRASRPACWDDSAHFSDASLGSISHIWDDFGPKRATTWKGYAFQQVLKSCNQISSLTLDLGPKNASGHLAYLISDLTSTFSSLYHLTSFHLTTASFWFDELVVLLTYWPALTKLELSSLRGNSSSPLPTLPPPVSFKRLIIHSNTLSPQHISWLLRDQSCLTHLEIGLPGVERTRQIFRALEGVALSLVSLRLTNRFTEKGGDTAVEAPSPVLPVLALAPWLTHLELRTTYAGSPASHESLLEALSLLSLRTLWIEDTPTSGLRELVEKGVVGGALKELTKVVSVGVKRGKLAKGDGKEFRKVVEKWGVEWVSS